MPRRPSIDGTRRPPEYAGDQVGSACTRAQPRPQPPLRESPMTAIHKLLVATGIAASLTPALAAGDAEAGRALYQTRCTACHSLDYDGVGPAHRGVFGRAAAHAKGFAYSDALKASRLVWTEDALDRWLADP